MLYQLDVQGGAYTIKYKIPLIEGHKPFTVQLD